MKIIGFNLTKILVERKEKTEGKLQINQNIDIVEVGKEKIPITEDEALKIKFNLIIDYSNDFARLEFTGNLIIIPSKEEMKQFLKSWKEKKIPEESKTLLFNFIMSKCNIKALSLEDEMALPLHIPMPRLKFDNPQP